MTTYSFFTDISIEDWTGEGLALGAARALEKEEEFLRPQFEDPREKKVGTNGQRKVRRDYSTRELSDAKMSSGPHWKARSLVSVRYWLAKGRYGVCRCFHIICRSLEILVRRSAC